MLFLHCSFLVFLAWMAGGTEGLSQKCDRFIYNDWLMNTYNGPDKSYYVCEINGNLENDQKVITTDTSLNIKSNAEVTMVIYNQNLTVKFIPNSLFETFVNLEYLFISFKNKFETMKREYLRNANKLKNLHVYENSIQKLDRNVFLEAKNLEYINLQFNEIESIDKEAFNGLLNLKGVYLHDNRIKNMHPKTFSSITNLNILDLTGAVNCVREKFTSANQKYRKIETKISIDCIYDHFLDEDTKIKIQIFNDKIGSLTAELQANQKKIEKMTSASLQMEEKITQLEMINNQLEAKNNQSEAKNNQLEAKNNQSATKYHQLEAKLATQQVEPRECKSELQLEFTNHKNQIESKFAIEKLQTKAKKSQLDAKITQIETTNTQMEAKLTAHKLELKEFKSEALQEIAKHNIEEGKLSGQMVTLQNIYLTLVDRINDQQSRLAVLERKDG